MTPKIECRLPRKMEDGTRVPCFEEIEPDVGRPIVAVADSRDLDRGDPFEGLLLIPLDGEPVYDHPDRFMNGPWHYISISVHYGRIVVHETKWPDSWEERYAATDTDIISVDLDWDFGDDDGVETIRIPRNGVTIVVPLRWVPDDREVPRDTSINPKRLRPTPEERRRNGLTV